MLDVLDSLDRAGRDLIVRITTGGLHALLYALLHSGYWLLLNNTSTPLIPMIFSARQNLQRLPARGTRVS